MMFAWAFGRFAWGWVFKRVKGLICLGKLIMAIFFLNDLVDAVIKICPYTPAPSSITFTLLQ